jgi:hypothetical protein
MTSVPLSVHEVIAVGQYLYDAKRQKKNMWTVFWMGGTVIGSGSKDPDRRNYSFAQRCAASVQGVNVPVTLIAQLVIGIWLMARPDILPLSNSTNSATCDHLFGALVVTVAAVATAEVTRTVRYVNVITGLAIVACSLIFSRDFAPILISELLSGATLVLTSIPRGAIVEKYGSWDRFVK